MKQTSVILVIALVAIGLIGILFLINRTNNNRNADNSQAALTQLDSLKSSPTSGLPAENIQVSTSIPATEPVSSSVDSTLTDINSLLGGLNASSDFIPVESF